MAKSDRVQVSRPTIHCITNVITVNDCANVLHAIGAAPVMAHYSGEVAQVASSAAALVLNLGATESFEAMQIAIKAAKTADIPIIIDPVGAGGIAYRRQMFKKLVGIAVPTCVRGNMSEIKALLYDFNTTVGVDADIFTESTDEQKLSDKLADKLSDEQIVMQLAKRLDCIVVASGRTDIISDGDRCEYVAAGTEMLTHITGAGCMSSAMIGGFLGGCAPEGCDTIEAVRLACECMGQCGEAAASRTVNDNAGIMTFHTYLIDEISRRFLFQLI